MSKTAQRKRAAFAQGRKDAITFNGFRWARHPQMESYRAGFAAGRQEVIDGRPVPVLEKIRERFA